MPLLLLAFSDDYAISIICYVKTYLNHQHEFIFKNNVHEYGSVSMIHGEIHNNSHSQLAYMQICVPYYQVNTRELKWLYQLIPFHVRS